MNYFLDAFKKFADFSGRARRPEYWFFVLFIYIITFALYGIDYMVLNAGESGYGIFSSLFGLVTLVPSISVAVRRLHDTGRSGLWYLIALIPFGGLVLIYFLAQDSEPDNQYGPCPR